MKVPVWIYLLGGAAVLYYLWQQSQAANANMGGQNFGVQPGQTAW